MYSFLIRGEARVMLKNHVKEKEEELNCEKISIARTVVLPCLYTERMPMGCGSKAKGRLNVLVAAGRTANLQAEVAVSFSRSNFGAEFLLHLNTDFVECLWTQNT